MSEEPIKRKFNAVEYSIKYPFTNTKSKYSSFIQGVICIVLIPLILPGIVFLGYNMKLLNNSIEGEDEAPSFEEYDKLMKIGFGGLMSYLPAIVLGLFIVAASILIVESFITMLLPISLLFPALSIMYAKKKDYQEVYSSDLVELLFSKFYGKILIYYLSYIIVLASTIWLLIGLSLGIGSIILLPLFFYANNSFLGYIYSKDEIKL